MIGYLINNGKNIYIININQLNPSYITSLSVYKSLLNSEELRNFIIVISSIKLIIIYIFFITTFKIIGNYCLTSFTELFVT